MMKIDEIFIEKTKDISFVELKSGDNMEIGSVKVSKDLPLPIITSELLNDVKDGSADNSIDGARIIDGMINLIGADPNFNHVDDYVKILVSNHENIEEYILYQGIQDLERNFVDAGIKFRTILKINPDNVKARFNYALALELIATELIKKEEYEDASGVLGYTTNMLESILDIDEKFDLAYYKLGYHYKNSGQFLKSSLIWNKFINISSNDILIQEIREEIEIIEDDTNMETAITYLMYEDYEKALESLLKLLPKHEKLLNVNIMLGQAYKGLQDYNRAIGYYMNAIKIDENDPDAYNEMAILYFEIGDIAKAIEILDKGIEKNQEDYKLYFNRGLANIEMDNIESGLDDIDRAIELNPEDHTLIDYKKELEMALIDME